MHSPLLEQLAQALQCLPGVGSKSAQRMLLHLLDRDREAAKLLARTLEEATRRIGNCECCRMLCEDPVCRYCSSDRRDSSQICVVETPADLLAIEHSGAFNGKYFVLMGQLSPIDGIGPSELGLDLLEQRLRNEDVKELVLATSVTVEGDATANMVASLAKKCSVPASRIAYGVPVGGELEFVDSNTLSRALAGRRGIELNDGDLNSD